MHFQTLIVGILIDINALSAEDAEVDVSIAFKHFCMFFFINITFLNTFINV